eukprot:s3832_g6.t1
MSCPITLPLVDHLRDLLESALGKLNANGAILATARGLSFLATAPAPESVPRWPLLSAWRWMVALPSRERDLSADYGGHSAYAVQLEGENELAQRGVIPAPTSKSRSATASGVAALRHLRWLAPTEEVILAPSAGKAFWLSLAQSKGIPVRSGPNLSWGHRITRQNSIANSLLVSTAPWSTPALRPVLHLRTGPLVSPHDGLLTLCVVSAAWHTNLSRLQPCAVHFRPLAPSGIAGRIDLHVVYGLSAEHNFWICPDCSFAWITLVASCPLRNLRPPQSRELQLHLEQLAAQTQMGAGHNCASESILSCRRVKRWLVRYLNRTTVPVRFSSVLSECHAALGSLHSLASTFNIVVENLRREGALCWNQAPDSAADPLLLLTEIARAAMFTHPLRADHETFLASWRFAFEPHEADVDQIRTAQQPQQQVTDSTKLHVSLPSGRSVEVSFPLSGTIHELKMEVQQAFRQRFLRLAGPGGILDPEESLEFAGLQDGDSITAVAQQKKVAATSSAFALWCVGGDRIVTWGHPDYGGDSSGVRDQLRNIQELAATGYAFAAILGNGHVVSWGHPLFGGDSTKVQGQLRNVQQLCATRSAFAAVLANGRVVTWGFRFEQLDGNSTALQDHLKNVQQVHATEGSFAAVLADGSVVTWGHPTDGGNSRRVQHQLRNVQQVHATCSAFAAVLADATVVTWGDPDCGGDSRAVCSQLSNVQQIHATRHAFAAVLADGSVVTWGDPDCGGDSKAVSSQLRNVRQIQATASAFAAILADGSVVTWGTPVCGGDSSAVRHQLRNVQQVCGASFAFAAILADRTVVTWGDRDGGGDSKAVREQLRNVEQIHSSENAFAAILADGSIVTWGHPRRGGDSMPIQHERTVASYRVHLEAMPKQAAIRQTLAQMPLVGYKVPLVQRSQRAGSAGYPGCGGREAVPFLAGR